MKPLVLGLILLVAPVVLNSESHAADGVVRKKFVAGGTIHLHLKAGGYTISPSDSEDIVVTYHANSERQLHNVRVEIKPVAYRADVYVSDTPHSNFKAAIEVPRHSNLWGRLTAGDLEVEAVEGDKSFELLAGRIQVDIPHPDDYGHRDASVTTGSIESSAFGISKGGLFRSFEQHGPGKYRLHAHVMTGEIDLRGSN